MKGNDIAACLVIALGVGGVLAGSLLGVGKQEQALPAAEPQPVAAVEPAATPEPTPEPQPVVETVRFSATGDDLIHKMAAFSRPWTAASPPAPTARR